MITEDDIEAFREMNADGFAALNRLIRVEEQGRLPKKALTDAQLLLAAKGARALSTIIYWQNQIIEKESLAPQ